MRYVLMETRCVDFLTLLEEYQILTGEDIYNLDNDKQSLLFTLWFR